MDDCQKNYNPTIEMNQVNFFFFQEKLTLRATARQSKMMATAIYL